MTRTSLAWAARTSPPTAGPSAWAAGTQGAAFAVLALTLVAAVSMPATAFEPTHDRRVVAIGDIHGAFEAFVEILTVAALIAEDKGEYHWVGGDDILVQTGDFLDRGERAMDVLELLMELQGQAQEHGGQVIVLLGNHEGMNLSGSRRDVHPQVYKNFVQEGSKRRQKEAFKAHRQLVRERARALKRPAPTFTLEKERQWYEAHPPGYVELSDAMGPKGRYGLWLRSLPAAVRLGDVVFLHGGVSPSLGPWTVEQLNQRLAGDIAAFDRRRQNLIDRGMALTFSTPVEVVQAAYDELIYRRQKLKKSKREPTTEESAFLEELTKLVESPGGYLFDEEGPLWFRGFARWSDEEAYGYLPQLVADSGVAHFVTAHTPQRDGRITVRFGGKIFLIDTGMLKSVYKGGQASALEISGGRFTAIYPDRRVVLNGAIPGDEGNEASEGKEGNEP